MILPEPEIALLQEELRQVITKFWHAKGSAASHKFNSLLIDELYAVNTESEAVVHSRAQSAETC